MGGWARFTATSSAIKLEQETLVQVCDRHSLRKIPRVCLQYFKELGGSFLMVLGRNYLEF